MRLVLTLPALRYPTTTSLGSDKQWKLLCVSDGNTSNILPRFSVFFCSVCQNSYASLVKAYCLTNIVYLVSIFSDEPGINVIGAWFTISFTSLFVDTMVTLFELSVAKQVCTC